MSHETKTRTATATVGPPVFVRERRTGWRAVDLAEILAYRDLFYFLVLRNIKILYKQTVLGFGWAILKPFFSMIVFTVIFGRLAKVPSDGIPYPIFSYAALVPWTYFQTSMTQSTNSLVQNSQLFTKVYFPRIFIPLAPVVSGLVDFAIAMTIVGVMMAYYRVVPGLGLLFLPALILLMVLTAAAVGMWSSVLAVQYRDIRFTIQFAAQLLMYAAPVVWPASLIPHKYRLLYGLYPMAGVIEGFRSALLGRRPMPWDLLAMGTLSAATLFIFALLYFRRAERVLADVV